MTIELVERLRAAEGHSRHVVVVFLDVRGFSSFAKIAESSDAAEFLKSAYITILQDYFPDAEFVKPTGDGLLVIVGYDRATLTAVVRQTVDASVELVEAFPTICDADPMVNFEVPRGLGIGLARGAATSLVSDGLTLDYSGRPLNLASRLMDLARPSGVVFEGTFGVDLLEDEMKARFAQESVYVKGISEDDPITVWCLAGNTVVPPYNKSPMNQFARRTTATETVTLKELIERGSFRQALPAEPARKDDIVLHYTYPAVRSNGTKHPKLWRVATTDATYVSAQGHHYAVVDYGPVITKMKGAGVKIAWPVSLTFEYSVQHGELAT